MPDLQICPVRDAAAAARWHEVDVATRGGDVPADPLPEVLARLDARPDSGQLEELWLGVVDGGPVTIGEIRLPVHDNMASAEIDVRVRPEHRRCGWGRTMLTHLLDRVKDAGRTRVFGEVDEPLDETPGGAPTGAREFAAATGARPVLTDIRRRLDLATVDAARLASLRREAATFATGFSLLQWVDHAPDEVVDDLAVLTGRMSTDTPLEEMDWEPEVWNADRLRAKERDAVARGRRRVVTAARHDATGRLVGYTDIGVNVERPAVAYQWDTIVAPEHRGHRLGLLMKAANLELLRRELDGVEIVNTWNAEINTHMIAVNAALGFRAVERSRQWQLDL